VADTDELTQLLNRRGFPAKIALAFASAQKQGRTLALAMLDIDHFKEVNDTFGHLAGDQVLRQVALILKKHGNDNDLMGRYGGDEFVIAAPDLTKTTLLERCETIRAEIAATAPEVFGLTQAITIIAGVSDSTEAGDVHSLIHEADTRLYLAKRGGRNGVRG
jgi:diguanylate cyclase (GGDEF)-like protein